MDALCCCVLNSIVEVRERGAGKSERGGREGGRERRREGGRRIERKKVGREVQNKP